MVTLEARGVTSYHSALDSSPARMVRLKYLKYAASALALLSVLVLISAQIMSPAVPASIRAPRDLVIAEVTYLAYDDARDAP